MKSDVKIDSFVNLMSWKVKKIGVGLDSWKVIRRQNVI